MLKFCILLLATTVAADYSYTVSVLRVENPSGLLQNGKPCSQFAFAGTQCSLNVDQLVINGGVFKLGRVSDSSNVAVLSEKKYGDFTNPMNFPLGSAEVYQGINVTLTLKSDAGDDIDFFQFTAADASTKQGINTYTSAHGTSITVAWVTDLPAPSTEAPTTPEQTTVAPTHPAVITTSGPVTAVDCEDYTDRKDGVKNILIGENIVSVYCQYGGTKGSLTAIQSRGNNTVSFDKTVDQYKSLFGTAGKGADFWIGLDNMNNLTNTGSYGLRIDLCCSGVGTVQTYPNFKIGAGPSYILTADVTSSTGLNLMNINTRKTDIGQPFITYREANHNFADVCDVLTFYGGANDALLFSNTTGGWWFGSCSNNLNGALVPSTNATCAADFTTAAGAGIEMRTTTGLIDAGGNYERYFEGVTYDRVRMSLYRMDTPVLGLSDNAYCS